MMTGQLIAGASVMNAVKSQQIIMFLISGAAAFGTLSSVMVSGFVSFVWNAIFYLRHVATKRLTFYVSILYALDLPTGML